MKRIFLGIIFLLFPLSATADPFIISDAFTAGQIQPTHCYVYVDDSSTPEESTVALNHNGQAFCRYDLVALTTGTHLIEISAAFKSGGILQAESETVALSQITKDACSDASVCIYKYQIGTTIIWYK